MMYVRENESKNRTNANEDDLKVVQIKPNTRTQKHEKQAKTVVLSQRRISKFFKGLFS